MFFHGRTNYDGCMTSSGKVGPAARVFKVRSLLLKFDSLKKLTLKAQTAVSVGNNVEMLVDKQ